MSVGQAINNIQSEAEYDGNSGLPSDYLPTARKTFAY